MAEFCFWSSKFGMIGPLVELVDRKDSLGLDNFKFSHCV